MSFPLPVPSLPAGAAATAAPRRAPSNRAGGAAHRTTGKMTRIADRRNPLAGARSCDGVAFSDRRQDVDLHAVVRDGERSDLKNVRACTQTYAIVRIHPRFGGGRRWRIRDVFATECDPRATPPEAPRATAGAAGRGRLEAGKYG